MGSEGKEKHLEISFGFLSFVPFPELGDKRRVLWVVVRSVVGLGYV